MNNNEFSITISDKEKIIYLENLKGKIFKLLPLYEQDNNIVPIVYLNGLLMNISSSNQMFDGLLIDLLVKLNEIRIIKLNHAQLRKIILESLDMVDILVKQLGKGID